MATQPIRGGATLATIPWSHVWTVDGDDEDDDVGSSSVFAALDGLLDCSVVNSLAQELALDSDSPYAPLMLFLQDAALRPPMNHLPSNWTKEGQTVLQYITNTIPPQEPTEWLSLDFYTHCQGQPKDATAALLAVQWSDEGMVVPLLAGMYAHRNGNYTNADAKTFWKRKIEVIATRNIQAGEMIFMSHNLCKECAARHSGYGTAGKPSSLCVLWRSKNNDYRLLMMRKIVGEVATALV